MYTEKNQLFNEGFAIGGIRQPTVDRAILRVITRLGQTTDELKTLCQKNVKNF